MGTTVSDLHVMEQKLLKPSDALIADVADIAGDIIILGVGGKMGPAMARVAKQAIQMAGVNKRVIGVSRFSDGQLRSQLQADGIETYSADLLDEEQLKSLPDAEN